MASFPLRDTLFNINLRGTSANELIGQWFDTTKQLLGAMPSQSLLIQDGAIAPRYADLIVDTEGRAAADDLEIITPESTNDGMIIRLKALTSGRTITVKHNPSQQHGISLAYGQDVVLSSINYLQLKREGNKWVEYLPMSASPVGFQQQILTSGNWVVPYTGTYLIETLGGGGGGGGAHTTAASNIVAGGGGASGVYKNLIVSLKQGQTIVATIGAPGAGGTISSPSGTNGGGTSFGSFLSSAGGNGGRGYGDTSSPQNTYKSAAYGGNSAGSGSMAGENASFTLINLSTNIVYQVASGAGADSLYGSGGNRVLVTAGTTVAGNNATGNGAGGSGGATGPTGSPAAGGAGSGGLIIVTFLG